MSHFAWDFAQTAKMSFGQKFTDFAIKFAQKCY